MEGGAESHGDPGWRLHWCPIKVKLSEGVPLECERNVMEAEVLCPGEFQSRSAVCMEASQCAWECSTFDIGCGGCEELQSIPVALGP